MSFWDWFHYGATQVAPVLPLTPEEVKRVVVKFGHQREWICTCGARLAIRSRVPHTDNPSNCRLKGDGHAVFPPTRLTWNGLAVERGWKVDPVECPACQRGLSVAKYKDLKRSGQL